MTPAILLLVPLLACGDKDGDDTGTVGDGGSASDGGSSSDGGSDGGSSADGGSDGGSEFEGQPQDITAELADIVTVVKVSWTTAEETTGWVEFGETEAYGLTTNVTEPGTSHEVWLLGNPANTEVHFQVHVSDGTAVNSSDDLTITTGSLPSGLPTIEVTGGAATQWNYQVVPTQGSAYAVTIIDNQGRYVWYNQLEPEGNLMRAQLTEDRQWVVMCLAGPQSNLEQGRIRWVRVDGGDTYDVDFPFVDHDMVVLPDNTVAAIVVTQGEAGTEWSGSRADRIVELSPDGTETEIWNAWDELDFDALGIRDPQLTHGNALDYVAEHDAYYIALKTLGSIAKVDRATGNTEWIINGIGNQFTFPEGDEIVQLQHQFEVLDGGLLIFDNGTTERGYSRAVELEIDEEARTAHEVWEYIRDPSVYVFAKGDVARFADGTTQVVWSASGEIQNVTPEGEVLWQANTSLGQGITFVQLVDDLYARD